ncbi:hypothetical protein [Pseudonocardia asaccharolytica]|uniref:DUF2637 domain-containing protein n=1 Tax=Pseudonocardia asaccharolytica DSM 44247 = NBRC 16224 TaxID=1123024 RepID=A0A511DCR7_9PSEU|nr:hypothetical protein [Pseudonocardia asaccharolytica]GEL20748.1 hypothetical protein PA7_45850 [Pseudonocardia asaccharolytica DSM 44247 = NBRC 16224]
MTTSNGTAGRVARLAAEADEAAGVRELTTNPDVVALRVEKIRSQVDMLLWAGIVLGLAFTMVNVQTFAAAGAESFSAAWWVAWLLDPMVSLVLLAVLRAEQVTARYQVSLPIWARRTKWLTFAATYVMNTWTSWGLADAPFSASGVVLHSVPPLVVFATAETGPGLRDRLTEAVHRAMSAHQRPGAEETGPRDLPVLDEPVAPAQIEPAPVRPVRRARPRRAAPRPRRLLADYLDQARAELRRAEEAGEQIDPSPAWCRRATGCSAGTSVKLAAALRAPAPTTITERQEAA